MKFTFKKLTFEIENEKIYLKSVGNFQQKNTSSIIEASVSGQNKASHGGTKIVISSEGNNFKYVSHSLENNKLIIIQETPVIRAETVFEGFDDTDTVAVYSKVTNITGKQITLEEVSSAIIGGITPVDRKNVDNMFLTTFVQSHHGECQPLRLSFEDCGFFTHPHQSGFQKKISFANVGGWSTKERLPQGIVENSETNDFLMFQIESSNDWFFEISSRDEDMYLCTGLANTICGSWWKKLAPGESYTTITTAISTGKSINEVVGEMTKYRRHISGLSGCDNHLPTIFNEYMHLAWDSPSEETTRKYAPIVAKTGVEYYVIDCGWFDEVDPSVIYHYLGAWKESKTRFPSGLKKTMDFIKSLGMKPGLWIEPEIIGHKCAEMQEFYDGDCFWQRNGERLTIFNRQFLDYRHPKVIDYMSETIRRMVEDYGAEYIKFDWNQDPGVGTDFNADSFGDGLEKCNQAFLNWIESMKKRFPHVVFEGCASGGMRMDYKSLRAFSLVSTSDQTQYNSYPYIAGNILSAVIPEQAAVWAYPVGNCSPEQITDRQIIVNMINSFLGRMHLASHLDYMTEEQLSLVAEGVSFYNTLTNIKKRALPYFPLGFTKFGEKLVSAGLKDGNKIYLAVWNLDNQPAVYDIPFESEIYSAKIVYPCKTNSSFKIIENTLNVEFYEGISASFFEIELV